MVVAAIAGVIVGALGVVPLCVAAKKVRKSSPVGSMDMLAPFLITIIISLVILLGGMLICKVALPDIAKVFAIAEFAAFIIGVLGFGIYVAKRK